MQISNDYSYSTDRRVQEPRRADPSNCSSHYKVAIAALSVMTVIGIYLEMTKCRDYWCVPPKNSCEASICLGGEPPLGAWCYCPPETV